MADEPAPAPSAGGGGGTKRIYLGRLPQGCTKRDVEELFTEFKLIDTRIMGGFGFLEFENERDVEDAVRAYNGKTFMGSEIIVEPAKENNRRADRFDSPRDRAPARGPQPGRGVRVLLKGLSPDVSWQDLKDFGREGGPVSFADVDRNRNGDGTIEYPNMADARDAVERLNTLEIKGSRPTASIDDGPAPSSGGRYDDRNGGGRGGYGGYSSRDGGDRYDDRRRDDYPRRDRSPPRGGRGGDRYDDRPRGGYDDRRGDTAAAPLRGEYARDRSPPPRRRDDYPPRRGDDRGDRGGRDYDDRDRSYR